MDLSSANLVAKAIHRLRREEKKGRVYDMYKPACFFLRMVLEGRETSMHIPQTRVRRIDLFYQFAYVVNFGIPVRISGGDLELPQRKQIKLHFEDTLKADLIKVGEQLLYYRKISDKN